MYRRTSKFPVLAANAVTAGSMERVPIRASSCSSPFHSTLVTLPSSGNDFLRTVLTLTGWLVQTGLSSGMPRTVHHLGGEYRDPSCLTTFIYRTSPSGMSMIPKERLPHGFWISSSARPLSAISASTPNTLRAAVRVSRDLSRSLSLIVYFFTGNRMERTRTLDRTSRRAKAPNRADCRQEAGPDEGCPLTPPACPSGTRTLRGSGSLGRAGGRGVRARPRHPRRWPRGLEPRHGPPFLRRLRRRGP